MACVIYECIPEELGWVPTKDKRVWLQPNGEMCKFPLGVREILTIRRELTAEEWLDLTKQYR